MATYCRMTSDGLTVTEVVKVRDEDNLKNGVENEGVGITFLTNLYNWSHWRKTSKSTGAGKHWTKDADGVTTETPDQSKAYRFNFGNPGSIYDEARDMFRKPNAPYPSWSLNESTGLYDPPVAKVEKADDGVDATHPLAQTWDEGNQTWTLGDYTPVGNIVNL